MTTKKYISKAEKYKKDKYLQDCLERRHSFTPMIYSADRIPGAEALAAQMILATLLSFNLNKEYYELCGLVQERMSLEIVRYNSLLLCGPQDKEAQIFQWPDLIDGVLMSLLAPWCGYRVGLHAQQSGIRPDGSKYMVGLKRIQSIAGAEKGW